MELDREVVAWRKMRLDFVEHGQPALADIYLLLGRADDVIDKLSLRLYLERDPRQARRD